MKHSKTLRFAARLTLAGCALAWAGTASALSYEYPWLYRDPRSMAMGGAAVAVGGRNATVFSNPAGLSALERGSTVELLPLNVGYSDEFLEFSGDLSDALDIDDEDAQRDALTDVVAEYRGRNFHGELSSYNSYSWRGERLALSFGLLAAVKGDFQANQGAGDDGAISVDAAAVAGPVWGASFDYGEFSFGAAAKLLSREGLDRSYLIHELMDLADDSSDADIDDDIVEGTAFGVDLGMLWRVPMFPSLKPVLGVSALNLGDLDFGDAGVIPGTVNVGVAIHPQFLDGLTVAVDYVDLLGNYEQDEDLLKRLNLGVEARLLEKRWFGLALQAGLHQGYYTAGIEARLAVVRLGFATYAEEVGAYGGQDDDRRYLINAAITW